jgi:hypothetical protein
MQKLSKPCSQPIGKTSSAGTRTLLVLLSLLATPGLALAQDSRFHIRWDEVRQRGQLAGGVVLEPEHGTSDYGLKVINNEPRPVTVTVLTIDQPAVKGPRYSLSGQMRYENVEGIGYLELWNYFPGGGQYFSRTLGDQGPMKKISGSSGWRPFVLPFDATGAPPPTRLVLNVVLPGRGVVYLGPLELGDQHGASAIWFNGIPGDRLLGLVGTIVGGGGALIGVLTSLGRARRFVIASALALVALGILAFVAGAAGLISAGLYSTGAPLLLVFGFVLSLVPLGLLPTIRKRYEEAELRTMRAHDLA